MFTEVGVELSTIQDNKEITGAVLSFFGSRSIDHYTTSFGLKAQDLLCWADPDESAPAIHLARINAVLPADDDQIEALLGMSPNVLYAEAAASGRNAQSTHA